ncbi:MAG: PhzF family phenazine biosynthesis protein [Gammaproteobacteria bacterium]|jgi:PhzF family phenazine biosynthesis protein
MQKLPFSQVDVFTRHGYRGNPVAVILRAGDLSSRQMQAIANWTNLSETTFVIPATDPQADYQLRIFTPHAEIPFAGHPTIGTAHALLEAGMVKLHTGKLVQQCAAGLVTLHVKPDAQGEQWIAFELPEPTITGLDPARQQSLQASLGCSLKPGVMPLRVDVGPRWLVAQLADASAVLALRPDLQQMQALDRASGDTGVVVFGEYPAGSRSQIEVRAFAPAVGVNEDPVCGSGNGCVAAYIRETGQVDTIGNQYVATQGQLMGRDGMLQLSIAPDRIEVGGNAVTCINGSLMCE